jgi:hypothetical protein
VTATLVRSHQSLIETLVLDALARPIEEFGALVKALPGIYPTDVYAALVRLAATSVLSASAVGRLLEGKPAPLRHQTAATLLPAPHPLDYDWRFDEPTSIRLAKRAQELGGDSGPLALLGVASILPHVRDRCTVAFLDANPELVAVTRRIRPSTMAFLADIAVDKLPEVRASVVVADPPWYPEDMRAFIWAASNLSEDGGTLLLGAPPLELRPGMRTERDALVAWAQRCGYELMNVERGGLRYQSPGFEINALAAAGLPEVPLDWRVGELLSLRLIGPCRVRRPGRRGRHEWTNVSLDATSIRFRRLEGRPATADPRLVRIVPGDVLPTVSRRDARRELAMVWTSGNRVFGCIDPEMAHAIAAAVASDAPVVEACESILGHPLTMGQRRRVAIATTQLTDVFETESRGATAVLSRSRRVPAN